MMQMVCATPVGVKRQLYSTPKISNKRQRNLLRKNDANRIFHFRDEWGVCDQDMLPFAVILADALMIQRGGCDVPRLLEIAHEMGWPLDEWTAIRAIKLAHRRYAETQKNMSDAEAGLLLNLTKAERRELGITTMEACDETKVERAEYVRERRRERDRLRRKKEREENGARPHEESDARTQPWKDFGISESTWRRRGKPRKKPAERENSTPYIYNIKHRGQETVIADKPQPECLIVVQPKANHDLTCRRHQGAVSQAPKAMVWPLSMRKTAFPSFASSRDLSGVTVQSQRRSWPHSALAERIFYQPLPRISFIKETLSMDYTVNKLGDGKYYVMLCGSAVYGPYDTQAEAWRRLDRMAGESLNKREDTAEWIWKKQVDGGHA